MLHVLNAQEMKKADENTINKAGIPQLVLMERAALESKNIILQTYGASLAKEASFLVVAGTGNNGGDGVALARLLFLEGYEVGILISSEAERYSDALKKQMQIAEFYQIKTYQNLQEIYGQKYDVIVDALFGIGVSRMLSEEHQNLLQYLNEQTARKVALDIPSGISANDGNVFGAAFEADLTVTFGFMKTGLLLYPGKQYCGQIVVADIGIDEYSLLEMKPRGFTYSKDTELQDIFPHRVDNSHKGTYGKVLLLAGSKDSPGAALLAGKSIMRAGAGMLKMVTPACNKEIIVSNLPEAMFADSECFNANEALKWCDQIVIGPGLGKSAQTKRLITEVLDELSAIIKPETSAIVKYSIVIDADGLNLMAEDDVLFEKIVNLAKKLPIILTPHVAELARLLHIKVGELATDRLGLLEKFCQETGFVVVSKDAATLVGVYTDNFYYYINQTGNNGMATAGSGDVLAGILGAVLAGEKEKSIENCFLATAKGVYLHGMAGDMAAEKNGKTSLVASDIIDVLPNLLKGL